jgi:hypothetical protein
LSLFFAGEGIAYRMNDILRMNHSIVTFFLKQLHNLTWDEFGLKKEKQEVDLFTFERATCRVLSKYILDGETSSVICTTKGCGASLIYKDGCCICPSCGNSKCG